MAASNHRPHRGPGRPPSSEGAATRQRLIEVAGHHFARSGYGGAALKDIAGDARMTSGAIYYYFESKSELYAAVGDHWMANVMHAYAARLSPQMTLAERLKLYLEVVIDHVTDEPDFAWFWMHVDVEAPHHAPVAALREKVWRRSIALRTEVATGTAEAAASANPVEKLDDAALPPGSHALPAVLLIEALALGVGRVAIQQGGPARLTRLLETLKRTIDGQIDDLSPERRL
jgi:AcrR family transcriptional regulator